MDRPVLREAAVAALVGAPSGAPVVGLVGMGGSGKSTLARAIAADIRVRKRFPDGVVWMDVRSSPDIVALQTKIMEDFGEYGRTVGDPMVGHGILRDVLKGMRCLLVLDDVWHESDLHHFDFIPPGSALLVTCRNGRVLFNEADAIEVGTVEADEARLLLASHAGDQADGLEPAADEVLTLCGGLPLALAVAAGMSRQLRRWSSVAHRLRHADIGRLRAGLRDYHEPDLLRALVASIDILPPAGQERLREVAVLRERGPVSAVCVRWLWTRAGMDPIDADDLLRELVDMSLVQFDQDSDAVDMHDLLYHCARISAPAGSLTPTQSRLADELLARWGGLDAGLPDLLVRCGVDAGTVSPVDAFGLANVVRLLASAGRDTDVHFLLHLEWTMSRSRSANLWYVAHERLGTTSAYLADIRLAWQHASDTTDAATRAKQRPSLGLEFRYLLISSSIASMGANIPAPMLLALVDRGLWTAAQAFTYGRLLPDSRERAKLLSSLAIRAPENLQADIVRAVREITVPGTRARALAALAAAQHTDDQRRAFADEAVTVAAEADIESRVEVLTTLLPLLPLETLKTTFAGLAPPWRAAALARLAAQLTDETRDDVVDDALACFAEVDDLHRAWWLRDLAQYVPPRSWESALSLARGIENPQQRIEALTAIAAHLPEQSSRHEVAWEAMSVLRTAVNDDARNFFFAADEVRALARIIPLLPAAEGRRTLTRALESARGIEWPDGRIEALTALAPLIHGAERLDLTRDAITVITTNSDDLLMYTQLIGLARYLPVELHREALNAALGCPDEGFRTLVLPRLAEYLSDELCREALWAAIDTRVPSYRARVLSDFAPVLSADLLIDALDAARTIADHDALARALTACASFLPKTGRIAVISEALAATGRATWPYWRMRAFAGLAEHFSSEHARDALTVAIGMPEDHDRVDAVTMVAPHLPADLVAEALAAVAAIDDPYARRRALPGLAPHLPPEAMSIAFDLAVRTDDDEDRRSALEALLPHLPPDLLDQAVEVLGGLKPDAATELLTKIRGRAAADTQQSSTESLTSNLASARAITDPANRATALLRIVESEITDNEHEEVRSTIAAEAASAALSLAEARKRAHLLTSALAHLSDSDKAGLFRQALDAARGIDDASSRANAFLKLSRECPPPQREGLLRNALAAAAEDRRLPNRVRTMADLAPELPESLLDEAITVATKAMDVRDGDRRADVLADLAHHAPASFHVRIVEAAHALDRPDETADVLGALARGWNAREQATTGIARWPGYWRDAMHVAANAHRRHALAVTADAVPTILSQGGPEALDETLAAVRDVARWWP